MKMKRIVGLVILTLVVGCQGQESEVSNAAIETGSCNRKPDDTGFCRGDACYCTLVKDSETDNSINVQNNCGCPIRFTYEYGQGSLCGSRTIRLKVTGSFSFEGPFCNHPYESNHD